MKRPFPRRTLLVNGTLGVLLAGGVGIAYLALGDDAPEADAATRVARVERGTVTSSVSASGALRSARTRSLSFAASGTVAKIYVKAGDRVGAGEILARLDQTEAQESFDAARADLAATDADTSTERGYAGYLKARNAYNAAARKLAGTVLKAPFAGTVTAVNGTVGGSSGGSGGSGGSSGSSGGGQSGGTSSGGSSSSAATSGGSGFVEIADVSRVQIEGQFTEADTARLKAGQEATVTFDALSGVTATGKVTAIGPSPTTTDNVVKYPVTITLTKRPAGVRLGQTATAEITVGRAEDVLYVPAAAVRTAGGQSTVTVVRDGRRQAVQVRTGVKGDQGTEITSGLREGEQIVVSVATTGGTGTGVRQGGGMPGGGLPGGTRGGGGFRP